MYRKAFTMAMTGMAALAIAAGSAEAQGKGKGPKKVPPGHLPPAGMCRIWYDGVPPGRQPAPMSCREAERRAPRNARVIYGAGSNGRYDGRYDDRRDDGRYDGRYDRDDGRYDGRTRTDARTGRTRTGSTSSSRYCEDRNRDGYCDDVNRDGRTGTATRYPTRLPNMPSVWLLQRGDWRSTNSEWGLNDRTLRVRYTDANRDGRPEEVVWTNARNQTVQRWNDYDRDGRADRVVIFENGRVVRTIQ